MIYIIIIAIVGLSLFMNNVAFADEYENLVKIVKKDTILSEEAKEYECYEYWKNGKTKYDCIRDFCNTIQINIVQGQEIICKTIETKIKLKPLNKKEFFYVEIKDLDIYNIEHVKKYFSPTILPCALNEECDFLFKAEENVLNITQYNKNIHVNKDAGEDRLDIIDRFCNKENKQCEDECITSIYEIKKGYYQPYGNGILIKKIDRIIGTMMFSGIYFCKFEDFNKTKLLKCYRL